MASVNVRARLTAEAVEGLYEEMQAVGWDADIRLPTRLSGAHFAAYSLFLQFLLTWGAESPPGRSVLTYASTEQEAAHFVAQDHGFLAFHLRRTVKSRKGTLILDDHPNVRAVAVQRRRAMNNVSDAMHGPKFFVLAYGRNDRLPLSLFREGDPPQPQRTKDELAQEFAGPLVTRLVPQSKREQYGASVTAIASSLGELVDNTSRWATTDPWETHLPFVLRGVRCASYDFGHGGTAPGSPIWDYVMEFGKRGRVIKRLLEVAVFDSGPSIAAWRLQGTGTSSARVPMDEYEAAVTWCLNRNNSTASSTAPIGGGGFGLPLTLRQLDHLDALVLLRSGPVMGVRNYLLRPLTEAEATLTLDDWAGERLGLTEHVFARGCLWSTLIPIGE